MITYGPDYGKLAVIVEIIDHGRVCFGVVGWIVNKVRSWLTDQPLASNVKLFPSRELPLPLLNWKRSLVVSEALL